MISGSGWIHLDLQLVGEGIAVPTDHVRRLLLIFGPGGSHLGEGVAKKGPRGPGAHGMFSNLFSGKSSDEHWHTLAILATVM